MKENDNMEELMKELKQFNEEREWDKFHSPENLAKSISIEAGELLECFQWNSENYNKDEVCEELAVLHSNGYEIRSKPRRNNIKKIRKDKGKVSSRKS